MKLSIVTISYNNLEGLQKTLPSVLGQNCAGFEHIVVDGGSQDGSAEYRAPEGIRPRGLPRPPGRR